ncbi:MAG: hypothetical protein Q8L64_03330 [bacterium]|nr:hypothetical protein [bacterium]
MKTPARINIYVAHALTKAPPEFKEALEGLKADLEARHPEWRFLKFFGQGALPPEEEWKISRQDFRNVLEAHLVVDVVDEDSTGMGREAGVRIALGLPLLSVAHREWKKSRMVTGPAQDWPRFCEFARYDNVKDIEQLIEWAIRWFGIDPEAPRKPLRAAMHLVDLYHDAVGPVGTMNTIFCREAPVYDNPSVGRHG